MQKWQYKVTLSNSSSTEIIVTKATWFKFQLVKTFCCFKMELRRIHMQK